MSLMHDIRPVIDRHADLDDLLVASTRIAQIDRLLDRARAMDVAPLLNKRGFLTPTEQAALDLARIAKGEPL